MIYLWFDISLYSYYRCIYPRVVLERKRVLRGIMTHYTFYNNRIVESILYHYI